MLLVCLLANKFSLNMFKVVKQPHWQPHQMGTCQGPMSSAVAAYRPATLGPNGIRNNSSLAAYSQCFSVFGSYHCHSLTRSTWHHPFSFTCKAGREMLLSIHDFEGYFCFVITYKWVTWGWLLWNSEHWWNISLHVPSHTFSLDTPFFTAGRTYWDHMCWCIKWLKYSW